MATQEKTWNVANRLHSLKDSDNPEVNHIIAGADEIYDDAKGEKQSNINAQADAALADRYTKDETYSKEQLDSLITTPDVNYINVATFADLPQTGEADTVYRVSSYDGTQVDASKYALYAWNGTSYQLLAVRSAVGEVFDVSEYNSGATYETLTAALAAVPASVQRGGMSIKFILRTNTGTEEEPVYHDEYVQYRLMSTDWSTVITDWQGVDKVPTPDSDNLVRSGGVQNELALGAVYDVSAKNPTAGPNNDGKFESLSALLSDNNLNTLIPTAVRKGGMSIKFVQSSDNKYVQYRLTKDEWSTITSDWIEADSNKVEDKVFYVTDGSGNIIAKIDKDGVHSVDFKIGSNGDSVAETINGISGQISSAINTEKLLREQGDTVVTGLVEAEEARAKAAEDTKLNYSIAYNKFCITDNNGYIICQIDASGVNSVDVKVKVDEELVSVKTLIDKKLGQTLDSSILEVTDANGYIIAKIDANGVHSVNIDEEPNKIANDNIVVTDSNGYIIFKIDNEGIHAPNLSEGGEVNSDNITIQDKNGYIVARIDKDGIHSAKDKHAVACMVLSENYYPTATPTRDSDGNVTYAQVMFETGVAGSISITYTNGNSSSVAVVYGDYNYTITINRDSDGNVETVNVQ